MGNWVSRLPDVLVGVTRFTFAKGYCDLKWREMMFECVEPLAQIMVVSERPDQDFDTLLMDTPGWYAEDMLMHSREKIRLQAIEGGYEKMAWFGIDAMLESRADFERLISHDVDVVAPLIPARTDADVAVARRFVGNSLEQTDIPDEELLQGGLVPSGFPGADNIVIDESCFHISILDGHTPWYERVARGEPNVCGEEYWVWKAQQEGFGVFVDADVKAYHVHEDCVARMYKGIEKPLSELSW